MAKQTGQAWWTMCLGRLTIFAWSAIAACLFWRGPGLLLHQQADRLEIWGRIWLILTLPVLGYVIFWAETHRRLPSPDPSNQEDHKNRRVILFGLIGGFAIALPALLITALAFVTAFPHFFEAINTKGATVTLTADPSLSMAMDQSLGHSPPEQQEKKNAYILAVDLSGSTIQNKSDPQLSQISDVVDNLFSKDQEGVLVELVQHGDAYGLYAFAGTSQMLVDPDVQFHSLGRTEMPRVFKEALERSIGRLDPDRTDVVNFLGDLVGRLESQHRKFEHVTVILFSDFYQDPEGTSQSSLRQEIRGLMQSISQMENVHLLGVTLEARNGQASGGIDIRQFLRNYAKGSAWREFSLEEYMKAKRQGAHRSLLIFNLYHEQEEVAPLYLKYQPFPKWRSLTSFLKLPDYPSYDVVQLGLRADSDDALSRVNVEFETQANSSIVLGIGGEQPSFELVDRHEDQIPVRLKSRLDVSRSVECDLLVAVPSRAVVHAVRVVILPVIGDFPFQVFRWSMRLLGLILLLLACGVLDLGAWRLPASGWFLQLRQKPNPERRTSTPDFSPMTETKETL